MRTIFAFLLAALLVLPFMTGPAGRIAAGDEKDGPKEGKRKPRLTFSKETTYFTEPRDEDGFLDYAAALNKHLSRGVTPENNANVLFWRAFGPHPEGATMPDEFYTWMGIPSPPEGDDYFIDLYRYAQTRLKIDTTAAEFEEVAERTRLRPWKAKEFAHVAGWLKANDRQLKLVRQASQRTHYFSPLCPGGKRATLIAVLIPGIQKTREFASALQTRAMLHIGEGRYDEAWEDLLALHRIARHVASGPTLIESLVGMAIANIASQGDGVFIARAQLDDKALRKCLRDLSELPPLPAVADKVDLCERCMLLDIIMMIEDQGAKGVEALAGLLGQELPIPLSEEVLADFHWDEGLREVNRRYDRLVAALRVKSRAARDKQLDALDAELLELRKEFGDPGKLLKLLRDPKTTPQARGKIACAAMTHLFLPAVRRVHAAGDRTEQNLRNARVAFALAAYQRDHDRYPKQLAELTPKYLREIPQDIFAEKPLTYRPGKGGYLLYSVGMNGVDENGQGYDDDPSGDDLRIKIPLPELKKEKEEKKEEKKPRFTISKETTQLFGPKDEEGYIDYPAALNERLKKGVTRDNNCLARLLDVVGPKPEGANLPAEFYKWLGREAPPEKGDYFVGSYQYMKKHIEVDPSKEWNEISDELDQASARPWKTKEYPHIAGWLAVDEKPLNLAREAVKLPRFYHPLTPPKSGGAGLLATQVSSIAKCRDLAYSLEIRVMWHLGEGRLDEAWQDVLACQRLGRSVAGGATTIEGLVGIAIDTIANHLALIYLEHAKPDRKRLTQCLRDLQALPAMPAMTEKINLTERFTHLDTVMKVDRFGVTCLDDLIKIRGNDALADLPLEDVNWDPALVNANRWYDRLAAAMREKERGEREKQLAKISEELKALKEKLPDMDELAKIFANDKTKPEEKGRLLGDMLISLLVPFASKLQAAADRAEQTQRNLHVAYALALFKADNGNYPKKLDELSPRYLAAIPQDLYTGKALVYRPSEKGYLLYSFGPDGKDDEGRYYDDAPSGDDPRVRMPLPELKRD